MKRLKYKDLEEASWGYRFTQHIRNSRFRKIESVLTFQEFVAFCKQPCAYCAEPPELRPEQRGRMALRASGLDRVFNSEGYTLVNTVPCCSWCNRAKNSVTAEAFVRHCQMVAGITGPLALFGSLIERMTTQELENRFTYHRPIGNQPQRYEAVRNKAKELAMLVNALCPESREKANAFTQLEDSIMWFNAAIARNENESTSTVNWDAGSTVRGEVKS